MIGTPGPWKVVDRTLIATADGEAFAGVFEDDDVTPDYILEADARLIAAAPDLLEALREIASIGPASDAFANLELARSVARAAIAKAEGRS